jgi:NADH-quinone oxidoreductase subunit G
MSGLQKISLCLPESLQQLLEGVTIYSNTQKMAESLAGLGQTYDLISPRVGVFLGNIAQHHPRFSEIYSLAEAIASLCGATFGTLSEAANSVGADFVSALPENKGLNAKRMLEAPRKGYLLLNVEPELDCHNAAQAAAAMQQAEFVVALTAYKSEALKDADVLLPVAPFAETSGTFMSMEGRVQSFAAAVPPQGECRPAWKVLRVLGNVLGLGGFDYDSSEQVKNEIFGGEKPSKVVWRGLNNNLRELAEVNVQIKSGVLQRVGEVPMYQSDAIVRRAPSLQQVNSAAAPVVAAMNAAQLAKLGLASGDTARVAQNGGSVLLQVKCDERVFDNCVRVPACAATVALGDLFGEISVEKAA